MKKKKFKKSKKCIFPKGKFCIIFQNEKTTFQAIKTRSSKSRKINIFPKGLVHGFVANQPFFFLFKAVQETKMCCIIFENEKATFQAIKTRSSKSRKFDNVSKGLVHGFAAKLAIFPTFF